MTSRMSRRTDGNMTDYKHVNIATRFRKLEIREKSEDLNWFATHNARKLKIHNFISFTPKCQPTSC